MGCGLKEDNLECEDSDGGLRSLPSDSEKERERFPTFHCDRDEKDLFN